MANLATRTLAYVDHNGTMQNVVMVLVKRVEDNGAWKIGLRIDEPISWELYLSGDDVLETIITILATWWARLFIGGMPLANNIRWIDGLGQESFNCGLPALRERSPNWTAPEISPEERNPGNLEILSESTVPFPDPMGIERERPLFVFVPAQMVDGRWKCAFAFDDKNAAPIRYGIGDDWIQSFLDAAAMVRVIYEATLPEGWRPREGIGLGRFPYRVGRGYFIDEHR